MSLMVHFPKFQPSDHVYKEVVFIDTQVNVIEKTKGTT